MRKKIYGKNRDPEVRRIGASMYAVRVRVTDFGGKRTHHGEQSFVGWKRCLSGRPRIPWINGHTRVVQE